MSMKDTKSPMAALKEPGDHFKVAVRVRKLLKREEASNVKWKVEGDNVISSLDGQRRYQFDRVFDQTEQNEDVYKDVGFEVIDSAINGFNSTIFAYGQTASGKTHTMMGNEKDPGMIRLAVSHIFDAIEDTPEKAFLLRVSYIEIYNEKVTDLLSQEPKPLKVLDDNTGAVTIDGLREVTISSADQVLQVMTEGEKNRHFGETNMNEKSSRSHTILRIIIESSDQESNCIEGSEQEGRAIMVSHLNLVDLAGSERAAQTGAVGERFKEGTNINKSLMVLGQVIRDLSNGCNLSQISFRSSKLTRILKNSLGGNTKTAIICTVTPAEMEQTKSTLEFAGRAKTIVQCAHVNEILDDRAQMNRLRKQIAELQNEVSQFKNSDLAEKNELLMRKNADLLKQLQNQFLHSTWTDASSILVTSSKPRAKNDRRLTWCAPRVTDNRRMSLGGSMRWAKMLQESENMKKTAALSQDLPLKADCPEKKPQFDNISTRRKRRVQFGAISEEIFEEHHEDPVDGNDSEAIQQQLVSDQVDALIDSGIVTDIRQTLLGLQAKLERDADERCEMETKIATLERENQCQKQLEEENAQLKAKLANPAETVICPEPKNEKVEALEKEVENLLKENQEMKDLMEFVQCEKEVMEERVNELVQRLDASAKECDLAKQNAEAFKEESCLWSNMASKMKNSMAELQTRVDSLTDDNIRLQEGAEPIPTGESANKESEENERLKEKLSELENSHETLLNDKRLVEEEAESLKVLLSAKDAAIDALTQEVRELEEKLLSPTANECTQDNIVPSNQALSEEMESLKEKLTEVSRNCETHLQLKLSLESEVEGLKLLLSNKECAIEAFAKEISALREQLDLAQSTEKSHVGIVLSNEALSEELEDLKEKLREGHENYKTLSEVKASVEDEAGNLKAILREKNAEVEAYMQEVKALEEKLNSDAAAKSSESRSVHSSQALSEEMVCLKDKLIEASNNCATQMLFKHSLEEEVENLKMLLSDKDATLEVFSQEMSVLKEQLDVAQSNEKYQEGMIQALSEELESLKQMLNEVHNNCETLRSSKAMLEEQTESLKVALNEKNAMVETFTQEVRALEEKLNSASRNESSLSDFAHSNQALSGELEELKEKLKEATDNCGIHLNAKKSLEKEVESLNMILSDKNTAVGIFSQEVESLNAKIHELEASITQLEESNEKLRESASNYETLSNAKLVLEEEAECLKALLGDKNATIEAFTQDVRTLEEKLLSAIAQLVTNQALSEEMESMKEKLNEAINDCETLLQFKLSLEQEVENLKMLLSDKDAACEVFAQEMSGFKEKLDAAQSNEKSQNDIILTNQALSEELGILKEKLNEAYDSCMTLSNAKLLLEEESENLKVILSEKTAMVEAITQEVRVLEEKLETAASNETSMANMFLSNQALSEELESLNGKLNEANNNCETLLKTQFSLEEEVENLKVLLNDKNAAIESLSQEIELLNAKIHQLEGSMTQLCESNISIEAHEKALREKDAAIQAMAQELKTVEENLDSSRAIIDELEEIRAELTDQVRLLKDNLDRAQVDCDSRQCENQALAKQVEDLQSRVDSLSNQEELLQKFQNQSVELSSVKKALRLSNIETANKLKAVTDELNQEKGLVYRLEKEIRRLKEEIRRLTTQKCDLKDLDSTYVASRKPLEEKPDKCQNCCNRLNGQQDLIPKSSAKENTKDFAEGSSVAKEVMLDQALNKVRQLRDDLAKLQKRKDEEVSFYMSGASKWKSRTMNLQDKIKTCSLCREHVETYVPGK